MGGALGVSPIFPPSGAFCPVAPALPWVPWASVLHLPGLRRGPADPQYYAPRRLPPAPLGSLRLPLALRYPACCLLLCAVPGSLTAGSRTPAPERLCSRYPASSGKLCQEADDSPKFPSHPCEDMPRAQPPVGSCTLALACPGLLPAAGCKASACSSIPEAYPCGPPRYLLRGSITRPVSSRHPAPYPP
jgi:hypothetical protein